MNKTFNLNRFGRLFYKYTTEHYKTYLMSLIVLLSIMILGGGFLVYLLEIPLDEGTQTILFTMMLLLSGTIFTSTAFADLGEKKKAVSWLTLPATHSEKFLVAWVYTVVIFLIMYTLSFYLVLLVVLNIRQFPGHTPRVFNFLKKPIYEVYFLYAFLHGIAFWGAIYFKKLHFIKTAFLFFVGFGMLVIINKMVLGALFGHAVETVPPFGNLRIYENGYLADIMISKQRQDVVLLSLLTILSIIFWAAAFYRLKEKQVR